MFREFCDSHLAGCAVGQTRLVVVGQVEVCRTGALVTPTRRQKAKVTAPSISHLTVMLRHYRQQTIFTYIERERHFNVFKLIFMS